LVLGATACIGLLGVFCSAMIYHDTQRRLWKWQRSLLLSTERASRWARAAAAIVVHSPILPPLIIGRIFKTIIRM